MNANECCTRRLFSLDALRGLDMFYLVVVSMLLAQFFAAAQAPEWCRRFFVTHNWGGFTLYDLIMPLFIFVSGAAVPLTQRSASSRHIWLRFALLWGLGMLAQGNLQSWRWREMQPYSNTLQTIAIGYAATAYLLRVRNLAVQLAVPAALALAYGLILHWGGDYTQYGNATLPVERWFLERLLPEGAAAIELLQPGGWYWYTWFLPSLMFPVIAMSGAFATRMLRSSAADVTKLGHLAGFGLGSLLLGLTLEYGCGVRCVKHIFTVSFSFQAIGWSVLLYTVLYLVCDVLGWRRGWGVIMWFGRCSLFAYMLESVFEESIRVLVRRCFAGIPEYFPERWQGLVNQMLISAVIITMVGLYHRLVRRLSLSHSPDVCGGGKTAG